VEEKKDVYEFLIAGLPYKLKSEQPEDVVAQLVNLVDLKIRQALQATKSGSLQNAAVLAALNLAEEHILLKTKALKEINRFEEQVKKLQYELSKVKVAALEDEKSLTGDGLSEFIS